MQTVLKDLQRAAPVGKAISLLLTLQSVIWEERPTTRSVHDAGHRTGIQLALPSAVKIEHVSWLLYLVGSSLVFGSWVDLVPAGLGWIGWLMALAGWAVGNRPTPIEPTMSRAEQLEKLDLLRNRHVITEQEFQQQKRRLLDQPS